MRKDARKDAYAGSVDAIWRISSLSFRICARQDCFVFERPQVVFYCNFSSSRHVSKSTNLIGRIVGRFSRRCAHSHWRLLFSHEALNVGEYCARNSSRCVRVFRLKGTFKVINHALLYKATGVATAVCFMHGISCPKSQKLQ